MSPGYTRVTVTAERRSVELLLPARQPLGSLMPEILRHVGGDHRGSAPRTTTLTPVGGPSLHAEQSLAEAGVGDGSLLALDRLDEAVPHPLVYDVTETAEALSPELDRRWAVDLDRAGSAAVVAVALVGALTVLTDLLAPAVPSWWSLGAAAAMLAVLAAIPCRRIGWDAELLVAGAASLGLALVQGLPEHPWSGWLPGLWGAAALCAWQISRRNWAALAVCATTTAVLAAGWAVPALLTGSAGHAAGVAGATTAVMLGLAPRAALALSGLDALDDRVSAGRRTTVSDVRGAWTAAHLGLAGGVLLCATSGAAAVHGLLAAGASPWGPAMAVVVAALTALRARSMPLALERAALLGSATVSATLLAHHFAERGAGAGVLAVLVVVAALPLALTLARRPEHVGARLRLTARRAEVLATITLIPLLLGLFGLYAQLTTTFQE
ncbi:type VII secretion integral membrane protein EccD [Nesterenkonia halobia]|uniref:EccD-like transmembrane domain-containing protein n=1 Tax=Nesterenkonia halobia TaxID=37922 RepID=A0ABP6RCB2_9MICC